MYILRLRLSVYYLTNYFQMKRIKIVQCLIAFFMLSAFTFSTIAQQMHTVKIGETLYSVSKKYGVSMQDILKANPDMDHGLKAGKDIVIPVITSSDTIPYKKYRLKAFESFYSINNEFGVSQTELLELNPELKNGFRAGKYIKIPLKPEDASQYGYKKSDDEDEYIKELKKKESDFTLKTSYKVALLLPLYLDINDTITNYSDLKETDVMYGKSKLALEYYAGFQLAMDSLRKKGMAIDLYVYDTNNDKKKTFDIVGQEHFRDIDLVVGPFYTENFKMASKILSRRGIPVVAPVSDKAGLVKEMQSVFQALPSEAVMLREMSSYVWNNYGDKHITVIRKDNEEEEMLAKLMTQNLDKERLYNYKEILVEGAIIDSVHHHMDSTAVKNIILIPSNDKVFVTDLMSKLNVLRDSSMIVFTTPSIQKFKNIDLEYLMNLNVHFPAKGNVDYESEEVKRFVAKYRKVYNTEPTERFSFSGYDTGYYFLSHLFKNGKISSSYYIEPKEMLSTAFDFNYDHGNNGVRNKSVHIYQYKDFEINKVK